MDQLPIFVNLKGRNVILVGEGEMADAKQRLIERAGGICVNAARIGGEISWGGELRRIHVDRNDDRCALRARCADQRGVTGVERPHRGDEADRTRCLPECGGEFGAALDALHHYIDASAARSSSLAVRLCAAAGKVPAATSARHFVSPASA